MEKKSKRRCPAPILIVSFLCLILCGAGYGESISSDISNVEADSVRTVTLFYTADEHGYLESASDRTKSYGGAAAAMTILRQHGYTPDSNESLLLSGGDMWAGPAISSWFQGISTARVLRAMGYDAATIGNHEFDYGQEKLLANKAESGFPFLSANIIERDTGKRPDFIQPYIIRDVNGVKVAVIGLTEMSTSVIVVRDHVENLEFTDYGEALMNTVPKARAEGAELVVVAAHVCTDKLGSLVPTARELSIPLLAGAHCHSEDNFETEGIRIVGAGAHFEMFARIDIDYDINAGRVLGTEAELVPVEYSLYPEDTDSFVPDPVIEDIVSEWAAKIEKTLGDVIGYSKSGIPLDWPLFNLLVDSWLWAHPDADIAISNFGGYREKISSGEIKRTDIVTVWPFDNTVIEVELTGKQVMENLECCGGAVAGLTYRKSGDRIDVKLDDGGDLDPEAIYRVLVNSFIYTGGSNYLFSQQDPDGREIQVNWRDPVIDWILSRKTAQENPLEELLDNTQRGPAPQ